MKNFKQYAVVILLAISGSLARGQNSNINIHLKEPSKLFLNETLLTNKTKVQDLIKLIGEPSRTKDYKNGERSYFYDSIGFIMFAQNDLVLGLGVNYTWDGDEKFPKGSFPGQLSIGTTKIAKGTKNAAITSIKEIEFICPISIICASKDSKAPVNCTIAFDNADNLTQAVFLIK